MSYSRGGAEGGGGMSGDYGPEASWLYADKERLIGQRDQLERDNDELRAQVEAQAAVVKAAQEWARLEDEWINRDWTNPDKIRARLGDAYVALRAAVAALEEPK